MARITGRAQELALSNRHYALAPIAGDPGAQSLAAAVRFGPFTPGATLVIGASGLFHMLAGDGTVVAAVTNPIYTAGVFRFTLPDACTHLSMVQATGATSIGSAYEG